MRENLLRTDYLYESTLNGSELNQDICHDSRVLHPPKLMHMWLLTCPSLGVQVIWFLLMSSGTPYLLLLGVQNDVASLIWMVGAIFGAFAQPFLGALSDKSSHRWGKRKPFVVGGALGATIPLLALAHAEDIARWIARPAIGYAETSVHWQAQTLAVSCIFIITFALQAYAVGIRAIIIDNCSPNQQYRAASWTMRWNVLGNLILSVLGFTDTMWLSRGSDLRLRFRVLAMTATLCSMVTVGIVFYYIPDSKSDSSDRLPEVISMYGSIMTPRGLKHYWNHLPPLGRKVCKIQLYVWAAWFPVLYYMSTFAYEIALLDNISHEHDTTEQDSSYLLRHAHNYSILAPFAFALGQFVSVLSLCILEYAVPSLSRKLPRLWFISQCFLGCCLLLTFFVQVGTTAVIVVALLGTTGVVGQWVPFALVGAEVSELSTANPDQQTALVMGLHNTAISLPQIASALTCALVLALLRLFDVAYSVAWVFRLASMIVFWSSYLIYKLD
ncbi:putative Sucrose transporter [Seiridium cardinale]|uniref:Sucrose transporter n=1 Tax=Seiridium cardinale TaxID=138064 RepID=A0ABR2XMF8_9PEZI